MTEVKAELVPADPQTMLATLIDQKADPAVLQKFTDLYERWQTMRAVEAYNRDMIGCQGEMPLVVHDSENKFLKASYAKLESIQHACKPIYTKWGFALSWGEDTCPTPDHVRIICDVMHKGGHKERYYGDYPLDGKGKDGGTNMNKLQGRVSSNTYAQRDMLRSVFNITVAGKDLDGNNQVTITPDEIQKINTLIDQIRDKGGKHDHKAFLGIFNVQDLGDMPANVAQAAIRLLEGRLKAGAK